MDLSRPRHGRAEEEQQGQGSTSAHPVQIAPRAPALKIRGNHGGATGARLSMLNGTASGQWFGEGLLADPKSKALYGTTWHADANNGRVYL